MTDMKRLLLEGQDLDGVLWVLNRAINMIDRIKHKDQEHELLYSDMLKMATTIREHITNND